MATSNTEFRFIFDGEDDVIYELTWVDGAAWVASLTADRGEDVAAYLLTNLDDEATFACAKQKLLSMGARPRAARA